MRCNTNRSIPVRAIGSTSASNDVSATGLVRGISTRCVGPAVTVKAARASLVTTALHCGFMIPRSTGNGAFDVAFATISDANSQISCGAPGCGVSGVSVGHLVRLRGRNTYCFSVRSVGTCAGRRMGTLGLSNGVSFVCGCRTGLGSFSCTRSFMSPTASPGFVTVDNVIPSNTAGDAPVRRHTGIRSTRLGKDGPTICISSVSFRALSLNKTVGCMLGLGGSSDTFVGATSNG